MVFHSSEKRERHQLIESSIRNLEDVLNRNDVESGYVPSSHSQNYRGIIDHLVIPNVRNGVMELGRYAIQDSDCVPIWALHTGEDIYLTDPDIFPTSKQANIITEQLSPLKWRWYLPFEKEPVLSRVQMPNATAHTNTALFPMPTANGEEYTGTTVHGRPLLLLNMTVPSRTSEPDVLAHEFWHVTQALAEPVKNYATFGHVEDDLLRSEIEAYLYQRVALQELSRQDRYEEYHELTLKKIDHVLSLIRNANSDSEDPLAPSKKARVALAEAGYILIDQERFYYDMERSLPLPYL